MLKYAHKTIISAKTLRREMTFEEKLLWSHLKNKEIFPWRFRRQHVISNFIVDFYCAKAKYVIELDGSQHAGYRNRRYDHFRTKVLEQNGNKVVRFWNNEVTDDLSMVLRQIYDTISNRISQITEPPLSRKRGIFPP